MEARTSIHPDMGYTPSGVRQVVQNILAKKQETAHIAYERMAYSRARGQYVIFLSSGQYMEMAQKSYMY